MAPRGQARRSRRNFSVFGQYRSTRNWQGRKGGAVTLGVERRLAPQGHFGCASNVRQQIEVLVILVLAAVALADLLVGVDELDPLDPLDHLVAELVLDAQPQRRAVDVA